MPEPQGGCKCYSLANSSDTMAIEELNSNLNLKYEWNSLTSAISIIFINNAKTEDKLKILRVFYVSPLEATLADKCSLLIP